MLFSGQSSLATQDNPIIASGTRPASACAAGEELAPTASTFQCRCSFSLVSYWNY